MKYQEEKRFIDWELETIKANQFFNQKKFDDAELSYLHAKRIAKKLFAIGEQAERATAALVVSYHNLADLYNQKNELELAYIELSEIDEYLINYLDSGATDLDIMKAVRTGIDKTRAQLLAFMQKNKSLSLTQDFNRNKFNH